MAIKTSFPAYILMPFGLEWGKMLSERSCVLYERTRGISGHKLELLTKKSVWLNLT